MPKIALTVNGVRREIDAPGDTPLLWILRDELDLTGTKYGCGEGLCGACTVLEGTATLRSCQLPLAAAAGRSFTTIEGLSTAATHPVQQAWVEEDVAQCGFCQPGMILEVAALLARDPRPSPAALEAALDDHLCRCGSYPRIARAVARAAGGGGR
jgi:isoquinoline 1-oxidoreductase alpha subunit